MHTLRPGLWQIESVLVNEQTVINDEGFLRLDVTENDFVIQPIGLRFNFQQLTPRSAILESGGRAFLADFLVNENAIHLKLTRPEIDETIHIGATYMEASVPSMA